MRSSPVVEQAEVSSTPFIFAMNEFTEAIGFSGRLAAGAPTSRHILLIVADGAGRLTVDGVEYPLSAGKGHLLPPGTLYFIETEAEQKLHYCAIAFQVLSLPEPPDAGLASEAASPRLPRLERRELQVPFPAYRQQVFELRRPEASDPLIGSLERQARFCRLLSDVLGASEAAAAPTDADSLVERTIVHIRQSYAEELTVNALAERANMGRWRYTRLFKKLTGSTPIDYIARVRIDQAKRLLLQSNGSQADIAYSAGFRDESYFHRRFKQHTGMTPKQFARSRRYGSRIVALYMEDYLVALGIKPILQYQWGDGGPKPDYLGLEDTPGFEYCRRPDTLLSAEPDLILLSFYYDDSDRSNCAAIAPTHAFQWKWESTGWKQQFLEVADYFDKRELAEAEIGVFERRAAEAGARIGSGIGEQTVAFLRIAEERLLLYGDCTGGGYVGPIVYGELALTPPPGVRELTWGKRDPVLISMEQAAALDADHLFLIALTQADVERFLEAAERHEGWRRMPAIRNRRIRLLEAVHWLNNGILSHHKKLDDLLDALADG